MSAILPESLRPAGSWAAKAHTQSALPRGAKAHTQSALPRGAKAHTQSVLPRCEGAHPIRAAAVRRRTPNLRYRGAKAHTQSALPRETYYNRSRWSLAAEASKKLIRSEKPQTRGFADVSPQKKFNHKEHKEHKESIGNSGVLCIRFAAEASKNLENAESPHEQLDRGCFSRRRFLSRKERKAIFKTLRTLRT